MSSNSLSKRIRILLNSLPSGVTLVAAAKTRSAEEVKIAIEAGISVIGYNYLQEAESIRQSLFGIMDADQLSSVHWHMIGHLQRNKAKKAVELFDMIETVDSLRLAEVVNRHAEASGKTIPVLMEINSGEESNKTGVIPDKAESLFRQIAEFSHLQIQGLMTMGPRFGDPEEARSYFKLTKNLFDKLAAEHIPNSDLKFLSMGMSNTYKQAIEEGANIVRIGTKLFGERNRDSE